MNNLLIIIPHPDDETNLAGNIMGRLTQNWNVYILYSSLDVRPQYAEIRKKEAVDACGVWGIPASNIFFLGVPDTPNKCKTHVFLDVEVHKSIVRRIKDIINEIKPEYILGTDFDFHSDHRMLSLVFDEAVCDVVKELPDYFPIVLKGFCYETAYYGVEDYSITDFKKCVPKYPVMSNPAYEWDKRVSIGGDDNARFIWKRKAYKALACHQSQYAILHAKSIINADNVFWIKDTGNLALRSNIITSSGNPEPLNDFKVLDTDDIFTLETKGIDFSKGVWMPDDDDENPVILIKLPKVQNVKRIIIHGNPETSCVVKVDGKIEVGEKEILFKAIKPYGQENSIEINAIDVECIKIRFFDISKAIHLGFGISEIEIFDIEKQLPLWFQDNSDNQIGRELMHKWVIRLIESIGYRMIVFKTKIERKMKKTMNLRKRKYDL